MHDLVAAQDIVKIATAVAKKNRLKKVTRITVKLGRVIQHYEEIKPENLRFNFKLVKRNTVVESARLVILKARGKSLTISSVEGEK